MDTNNPDRITAKLIYILKRLTDEWISKQLCCGDQPCFNYSHLPLFMSIGTEGISNSALAERLSVTKQATSKIIKELEALNMVKSEKCATDARSMILHLTGDGQLFYDHVKSQILNLEEQYKKLVGAKNYEIAIDVMLKLISFHETENWHC